MIRTAVCGNINSAFNVNLSMVEVFAVHFRRVARKEEQKNKELYVSGCSCQSWVMLGVKVFAYGVPGKHKDSEIFCWAGVRFV